MSVDSDDGDRENGRELKYKVIQITRIKILIAN